MNNYKVTIEYLGKNYSGWQIQEGKTTIEGEITRAVKEISGEEAIIVGSGRTDAGVRAIGQVANFKIEKEFEPTKLIMALNNHLPQDISIKSAELVSDDFNARFSAKRKTYEYYFYVSPVRSSIFDEFALQVKRADTSKMQQACKHFVGEHDFSSFVASNSGKTNFVRTIFDAKIECVEGNLHKLIICGNGFLYNMVRIIMGTIILAGEGKIEPSDIAKIIEAKDRTKAGKTVSPVGLCLASVEYEQK